MPKFKLPKVKINKDKFKFPRLRKFNYWTLLAVLSYLNILVLIPLLLSKKNDFVKYHARQGALLFLFSVIAIFAFYVPYLPWLVIVYIAYCVVYGIINVFMSRERPLPLLGKLTN